MNGINPTLLQTALWRLGRTKESFIPSDAVVGGGGDGGPPSGGMPPDTGGGPMPPPPPDTPPPDTSPPGPPPPDSGIGGSPPGGDISAQVAIGVQQALMQSGLQGNQKPTAPKPDINTIATDVFQLKKMFLHFLRIQGIDLPPDILDGPNRDPLTGAPAMGPTGGSDAQPGSSGGGAPQQSSIPPIKPIQGAFPSGGGGGGMGGLAKTSSDRIGEEISGPRLMSKAAAVALMLRRQRQGEGR
jgi:hypothetical protein